MPHSNTNFFWKHCSLTLIISLSKLLLIQFKNFPFPQNALKEFVSSADTAYGKKHEEFFVGFDGRYLRLDNRFLFFCQMNSHKNKFKN